MKDHEIAKLVNDLRDIAIEYHAAGCLREVISRRINKAVKEQEQAAAVADIKAKNDYYLQYCCDN